MHAFDYVTVLYSFVFAMAISQLLASLGDLLLASRRVTFSWLHAVWMFCALMPVIAWWIGFWDLRTLKAFDMPTVGFYFAMACGLYVLSRLVCPRVPMEGDVDLRAFHRTEGRKYMTAFAVLALVTVISNLVVGAWALQNLVVVPMTLSAVLAAVFTNRAWVQNTVAALQIPLWAVYWATLQAPLTG